MIHLKRRRRFCSMKNKTSAAQKAIGHISGVGWEKFLECFYAIKEQSKNHNYGFDADWITFVKMILPLSPKSIGTKIQNRFQEKNGLISISASEDRGDCKYGDKYFEIKTSIINNTNTSANITGLRTWQKIDEYIIIIIDASRLSSIETYVFSLTKENMEKEMKILKAAPLNGTKESNKNNEKIPMRLGIAPKSDHFKRWVKNYTASFEL